MVNTFLFVNLAQSKLASPITNTATSITLTTGTGSLFPNPGAGQQFAVDLNDASTGQIHEIVYCTARVGDVLTVVRGQEGTTATSWLAGDYAANKATAGALAQFLQSTAVPGRLLGTLEYFAAGTFTPSTSFPVGTNTVIADFGGGGAQGGGAGATTAGQGSAGTGGGAGSECSVLMTATAASGQILTVGAGGSTGAAGAAGQAGAATTFGAMVSCPGGLSGGAGAGTGGPTLTGESQAAALPTVNSPATLIWSGRGESSRYGLVMSPANIGSGTGGSSTLGGGGGSVSGSAGANATTPSSGGSGAANLASSSATTGGQGAPGYAIFYCFS